MHFQSRLQAKQEIGGNVALRYTGLFYSASSYIIPLYFSVSFVLDSLPFIKLDRVKKSLGDSFLAQIISSYGRAGIP